MKFVNNPSSSPVASLSKKRLVTIASAVALVLLVPLVAMQFTREVRWSPADFVVMGVLLLGAALLGDLVLRTVRKPAYRAGLVLGILGAFLLIWLELAVGLFGTPFAGS